MLGCSPEKGGGKIELERFVDMALDAFYLYLGSLPDGVTLQKDLVMVCEFADRGERNRRASDVAFRLARLAEHAPLLSDVLVEVLGEVGGELKPC